MAGWAGWAGFTGWRLGCDGSSRNEPGCKGERPPGTRPSSRTVHPAAQLDAFRVNQVQLTGTSVVLGSLQSRLGAGSRTQRSTRRLRVRGQRRTQEIGVASTMSRSGAGPKNRIGQQVVSVRVGVGVDQRTRASASTTRTRDTAHETRPSSLSV